MDLLERLAARVVIADGAMGTLLRARGVPRQACLEELCATEPERVAAVHREYLDAGAQLIRTHSFGSNAARLERWGLERRVAELNWLAARIARDAAKSSGAIVAASVGPTERGCEAGALLEEQLGALLDGGAECVIFETFVDEDELLTALEVKQSLHHCPAVALMARVPADPAPLWRRLSDAGADVVGVNCTGTPAETLRMLGAADLRETALFPSAGLPGAAGEYDLAPEEFAAGAHALVERGARLVGGCCGTGPAHIGALAARLFPSA